MRRHNKILTSIAAGSAITAGAWLASRRNLISEAEARVSRVSDVMPHVYGTGARESHGIS